MERGGRRGHVSNKRTISNSTTAADGQLNVGLDERWSAGAFLGVPESRSIGAPFHQERPWSQPGRVFHALEIPLFGARGFPKAPVVCAAGFHNEPHVP